MRVGSLALHWRAIARRTFTTTTTSRVHLVVLVHGLHGEAADLDLLHHSFAAAAAAQPGGDARLHVLASTAAGDQSDGIDAAGTRVAKEIEAACDALGSRGRLSVVAHSNGGLVSRFAMGELEPRGVLNRWRPCLFLTLASPHLGVFPFGLWTPALALRVAQLPYFARAGRQLALLDAESDSEPLLVSLAEPGSRYMRALSRFERRVTFANLTNEVLVPHESAAIVGALDAPKAHCRARGNVVARLLLRETAATPRPRRLPKAVDGIDSLEGQLAASPTWRERMVCGLRSAGDWERVDVDFGVGALGWAHWLIAGHSLPLPVGDALDVRAAGEATAQRGARLRARKALADRLAWLVRALGRTEELRDVADLVTEMVMSMVASRPLDSELL